jgi:hypothetical protein
MSTSSDEQYRITKAMNGKGGMTDQDATDEDIDNALDESPSDIILTFKNGTLRKVENNGHSMNSDDRNNSLALDGRSKSKKENKKGKYGIGGFNSRCKLAGQGKQIMTSRDGDDIYQVEIDLEKLQDEKICPPNCWTGDHTYRPKWVKLESNDGNYIQGVTKEYLGDNLKQKFNLKDIALHIIQKYNKNIKNGVKFVIIWDDITYILPDIYNYNNETFHIDAYKKDGKLVYYLDIDGKCVKSSNKLFKKFKGSRTEERIGSYTLNLGYPTNYHVELNQNHDETTTNATKIGYAANKYIDNNINNILQNINESDEVFTRSYVNEKGKIVSENYKKIILKCGDNNIEFDIDNQSSDISNYAMACINYFIPEITISMDQNTLCCKKFTRTITMPSGGDMGSKKVYQIFNVELQFNSNESETDLSQEDKNKVDISLPLVKMIGTIIELKQSYINSQLIDAYNELEALVESEEEPNVVESEGEEEPEIVVEPTGDDPRGDRTGEETIVVEPNGEETIVVEPNGEETIVVEPNGEETIVLEPNGEEPNGEETTGEEEPNGEETTGEEEPNGEEPVVLHQQNVRSHCRGSIEVYKVKEQFNIYIETESKDGFLPDSEIFNKLKQKNEL